MGKVGKAKKQRMKATTTFKDIRAADIPSNDSEDDSDGDSDSNLDSNLSTSIRLLNVLGQRLDIYESKSMKVLRTSLYPLIDIQIKKGSHFETSHLNPIPEKEVSKELSERKLSTLLRTTGMYCNNNDLFLSADHKQFRAALHPLVVMQQHRISGSSLTSVAEISQSYSARISSAFRSKNWTLSLKELYAMYHSDETPKLGALQRWVRECDFALQQQSQTEGLVSNSSEMNVIDGRNMSLLLLDAVMRVAHVKKGLHPNVMKDLPSTAIIHHLQMNHESSNSLYKPNLDFRLSSESYKVLSHVPGALRRPPSDTDLNIFSLAPACTKINVPKVAGTFLLQNVLSAEECSQIIATAEAIGYSHDAVEGIDNIVLYADDSLNLPIFERCRHLLPQEGLLGINTRFRLFRYRQGAVYRPHIDGSWPGSGLLDGKFVDDVSGGKQNSKFTFLLYLNGNNDFEGGSTTFFLPGEQYGHIENIAVHPQTGSVLCFPHGDVSSPVHEGSEISAGSQKYVIRTDILYDV
eukprot:CAMPEP_0119033850 /NCGR_PEP_ID=MMETSP1177-20130426/914_1 /TAXON_ID=2985 /ORGANISM="Ochromonas sp, Strain CCMP1899" /LENGTH=520 /DNA_ID=CAMNT_0006990919 /DNA_START=129 /DNA_END=1691 /DNA_ORIENTATION=+